MIDDVLKLSIAFSIDILTLLAVTVVVKYVLNDRRSSSSRKKVQPQSRLITEQSKQQSVPVDPKKLAVEDLHRRFHELRVPYNGDNVEIFK